MNDVIENKRKIYNRDFFLSLFYCPKEVPEYLLVFPELLKNEVDDMWCKKPLPKFDEVIEGHRYKTNYVANKYKGRQRTTSNQSGDNINDADINLKIKSPNSQSAIKFKTDKYNRYNIINESVNYTSNEKEYVEEHNGSTWKTIESKSFKPQNTSSKPYLSNNQGQENHWKKWGKDRTLSGDKTFIKSDQTNNFVVKKAESKIQSEIKDICTSQSLSTRTDHTEDIWQDDWDTEMQSQIAITPIVSVEFYELPPSSITISPTFDVHKGCINNDPHSLEDDYNLWFYKDLLGTTQGPFSSEKMANWLATGYFDYATSLKRKCDEKFLLLAEYRALYGRIPFTIGHTIPPILQDTTIDIDRNQLIVGVDINIVQKVLSNATSLSSKITSIRQANISQDNASTIEIDKQAIIEEKRQLEECKAELDRERQRILDEQEQWKIRMENELKSRLQCLFEQKTKELNKTLSEFTMNSNKVDESHLGIEDIKVKTELLANDTETLLISPLKEDAADVDIRNKSQLSISTKKYDLIFNIDNLKGEEWLSTKDIIKGKKAKKAKDKSTRQSPLMPVAPSPEIKKVDSGASKLIKTSGSLQIISRDDIVENKQGTKISDAIQTHQLWNLKPTYLNLEQLKLSKSLIEIQAEETHKEKLKQELDKAINQTKVESNKITSFKESLLKNVKSSVTTPIIPPGKSIWDVVETVDNLANVEEVFKPLETKDMKLTKKISDNNNNNHDDGLLSWCNSKLSKFKKDLDVFTVVELLKQVPYEDVTDLTLELLDNSDFSRNFAKEFIKRRQDFNISFSKDEDSWQTVKKSQIVASVVNTVTISKKSKKKMVIIDHTKFK